MRYRVIVLKSTLSAILLIVGMLITTNNTSPLKAQEAITPNSWNGFYIGLGGGAALLDYDLDLDLEGQESWRNRLCFQLKKKLKCTKWINSRPKSFANSYSFNDEETYYFATLQLGVNQQINNQFVVGAFIDADTYFGDSSDFSASTTSKRHFQDINGSIDLDYSATIGLRAGFLVNPTTLFYGLIGYTYLKLDSDLDLSVGKLNFKGDKLVQNTASLSAPDDLDGLTLGAGVETKLSEVFSFKIEYRYTDLGDDSASNSYADLVTKRTGLKKAFLESQHELSGTSNANLESEIHSIRAVLIMKLNN